MKNSQEDRSKFCTRYILATNVTYLRHSKKWS